MREKTPLDSEKLESKTYTVGNITFNPTYTDIKKIAITITATESGMPMYQGLKFGVFVNSKNETISAIWSDFNIHHQDVEAMVKDAGYEIFFPRSTYAVFDLVSKGLIVGYKAPTIKELYKKLSTPLSPEELDRFRNPADPK